MYDAPERIKKTEVRGQKIEDGFFKNNVCGTDMP